jgi:hypothetical protein
MSAPNEQIVQLVLDELSGTISEENRELLHDIITDNEADFQYYMRMHEELDSYEVKRRMRNFAKKDHSRTLLGFLTHQLYKRWVVVVLLFVIKSFVIGGVILTLYMKYLEKQEEVVRLKRIKHE